MVEEVEGFVFESPLPIVHTQPVGKRGIDVHGFACDAVLLFCLQVAQRLNVVHAVCQLDQQNSAVLAGGYKHFAEVFDSLLFAVFVVSPLS